MLLAVCNLITTFLGRVVRCIDPPPNQNKKFPANEALHSVCSHTCVTLSGLSHESIHDIVLNPSDSEFDNDKVGKDSTIIQNHNCILYLDIKKFLYFYA